MSLKASTSEPLEGMAACYEVLGMEEQVQACKEALKKVL